MRLSNLQINIKTNSVHKKEIMNRKYIRNVIKKMCDGKSKLKPSHIFYNQTTINKL